MAGGRPEIPLDWERIDQLLIADCSGPEIAAHFNVHYTTIYDRISDKYGMSFTQYSQEKKQKGDSLIREKQLEKALEKDNTMLVWLGKNRLKQRDVPEEKVVAPKEEYLDIKAKYYETAHQLQLIQKELDDLKSKANPELQRSDAQVQSVDRCSEFGEDLRIT